MFVVLIYVQDWIYWIVVFDVNIFVFNNVGFIFSSIIFIYGIFFFIFKMFRFIDDIFDGFIFMNEVILKFMIF